MQCGVGFVEGLTPLLNGTLNICRHRKVMSTTKAYGVAHILID